MKKMSKETGSSRTDTIVKVMLVFFISLLSFSVGTFVGKQVSDSDHRRMALESEFQQNREVASSDGKEEETGTSKVTDKEVENLAEEFVNKEKGETENVEAGEATKIADAKEGSDGYKNYSHKDGKREGKSEKTPEPKAGKAPAKEKVSKMEAPPDEVSEKVANNKAVSDGEVEQRKPSSALPAVAGSAIGKFTVQVGSYATEDEAKGQAKQLKTKGWAAFYLPAAVSGKTWYRVMVGTFNNHNSAQAFRKDFMKESGLKSPIVQKIVQ
jgi:cell division protein FtsN